MNKDQLFRFVILIIQWIYYFVAQKDTHSDETRCWFSFSHVNTHILGWLRNAKVSSRLHGVVVAAHTIGVNHDLE